MKTQEDLDIWAVLVGILQCRQPLGALAFCPYRSRLPGQYVKDPSTVYEATMAAGHTTPYFFLHAIFAQEISMNYFLCLSLL